MAGLVIFNFYGDSMGFIVTEPCGPLPKFGECCGDAGHSQIWCGKVEPNYGFR